MSNSPRRRIKEHLSNHPGFARKYNICKIVYLEPQLERSKALKRERQIKGLTRVKKLKLIWEDNPNFEDLTNAL